MTLNQIDALLQSPNPHHNNSDHLSAKLCRLGPAFQKWGIKMQKAVNTISLNFANHHAGAKLTYWIQSSQCFACSGCNTWWCIFMNVLNGQHVVFCTFDRRNSQCAWLVDWLPHLFAHDIKFYTRFYACKPLANQALWVQNTREKK